MNPGPQSWYNAALMALHRASRLGSIAAALALVVSSGQAGVCPHAMPQHGTLEISAALPDQHTAMHHAGGEHSEHPAQGANPNCVCAGACLTGQALKQTTTPALVDAPVVPHRVAARAPEAPAVRSPTAYLRPLPNGPPLA